MPAPECRDGGRSRGSQFGIGQNEKHHGRYAPALPGPAGCAPGLLFGLAVAETVAERRRHEGVEIAVQDALRV